MIRTIGVWVLAALSVLLCGGSVLAADARSAGPADTTEMLLIEKALDDPAEISLTRVTLGDALQNLSSAIGVNFEADEMAVGKLPYGHLTPLEAVEFQGVSWREALTELLRPLALRFQVGRDRIYILGTKELVRQPRRLNLSELNALVRLQNSVLNDKEDKLLKQLRTVTGLKFGLVINGQRQEKAKESYTEDILNKTYQKATSVLDAYCRRLGGHLVWYVRAEPANSNGRTAISQPGARIDIIVVPAMELVRLKLDRRIDIEYRNQPVQTILQDLARHGQVNITFEPGCYQGRSGRNSVGQGPTA